jgi:DNA repair protein RecO (recombination protein O)
MERCQAIVLRKYRLTETSLIVHWLSAEQGRFKTVAKGALKSKGNPFGSLDLFGEFEVVLQRSGRTDLHALREARQVPPFEAIPADYPTLATGAYLVELMELATEPEHPFPELHQLMVRVLGHLRGHRPSRRAVLHFESELCRILGTPVAGGEAAAELYRIANRLPSGRLALLTGLAADVEVREGAEKGQF